jgi:ketosteroid isomerase-like protein
VEAFNRRDFDGALAIGDEATTWRPVFNLEAPMLEGAEAIRAWWVSQVATLDIRVEPQELIPVGEVAVVMVARWTGRGQSSGAPVTMSSAQVYEFRQGKLASVESYSTKAEALEAAGLGRERS